MSGDAANLIRSFLKEGAVCIESSGSRPALVCKTLIQLDGDVINWIAREAIAEPALLERHQQRVVERLREATEQANHELRKATRTARTLRWGAAAVLLGGNVALWRALEQALTGVAVAALTSAAWHFGARFAARLLARRALRALEAL